MTDQTKPAPAGESEEDQAADVLQKFIADTNARLDALEAEAKATIEAATALTVRVAALEGAAPPDASAVTQLAADVAALAQRTEHFITRVRSLL